MSGKKSPKIIVCGYYGFDNSGDEALLTSIVRCLRSQKPDVRITVLSGNPEKTREIYGVNAINRWSIVQIVRELLSCKLLISGGGSLIQDITSVRSPSYYLGIIRIALFLRRKVMIYCQGVGPLTDKKNRAKTAKLFNRCHAITIRDAGSVELLRELGVTRDITLTSDAVMALDRSDIDREIKTVGADILCRPHSEPEPRKPLLLVSMRCWKDNRHIEPVAELLDAQASKGWDVLLIPAHFPDDMKAMSMITEKMTTQPICVERSLSAREFLSLSAYADRVFSMRLHGLICAMAMGTPILGLSYDPKVEAFLEQAGLAKYCLQFDSFDLGDANRLMDELDNLPSETLATLEIRRAEMQKAARETAAVAISLLNADS